MYRSLRKESLKAVLPRIIALAVLTVILLGVSGGSLIKMASGPKPLDSVPADRLKGAYVEFDASEIIVAFASLTSKGDGGSKTLETYYLLPLGEQQYLAVMDQKEHNGNVIERAMEQSHEYYMGDLESLTKLGPLHGTVSELDEEMLSYMADCIDNYQLPGFEEGRDSQRLLQSYQINLDHAGFLPEGAARILGICSLVCLLLLAAQLAVVFSGVYQRSVRAVVGKEEDAGFDQAQTIERVRVGKYVWYPQGPISRALKTEDLIWGYVMPEPMVVSKYRWPVAMYDRGQKLTRIQFMDQKHCQDFLDAIEAQGHPFRKGYTSALAEQFQNDPEGFIRDAKASR